MKKTELKDVIHLYMGCEVQTSYRTETQEGQPMDKAIGILVDYDLLIPGKIGVQFEWQKATMDCTTLPVDSCKLFLRPLSDITAYERAQLWRLIFDREFPDNGGVVFIDKKTSLQEPRWVLSSGLNRLGILLNGEVWYDNDMQPHKFNQHLVTLFYLKNRFDIFGLIESDQALVKTKSE